MRKDLITALKTKFISVLLLLLFSLFVLPVNAQQYFKFEGKRKRLTIPFIMVKNLMVIPLQINGKGPFNFVLDTGVGVVLITDPFLLDSINAKNIRSVTIAGFGGGEDMKAYIIPSVNLKLAATTGTMTAAILQEDSFDLSAYAGMPIHGLIGYEVFNSFIVRINYSTRLLTLYSNESPYILRRGIKLPISIEEHKPYLQSDVVFTNGHKFKAKLIIDTGAGHPVSLESHDGVPFPIPEKRIYANLGVGLAGQIYGYMARIASLKLGKYELKQIVASFPDYDEVAAKVFSSNRNGNIGNSVMKRFDVVFDYRRETLYLRPNSSFREPFEHDMSGAELASFGTDYKQMMITRVEPGSAAAEAGLSRGDELLAINFMPVSQMSLDEIDRLFRSRDDKSFLLDIKRKSSGDRERVILTLKRRI